MKKKVWHRLIEFLDFSFVGVSTFLIQLMLAIMLTEFLGVRYYISYAIALLVAWTSNFLLNMELTFGPSGDARKMVSRFACLVLFNIVLNWLLVILFVEVIGIYYFLSIIIVTILLSFTNFLVDEFWVFKKKR